MSVHEWLYLFGTEDQVENAIQRIMLSSEPEADHYYEKKSRIRFHLDRHDGYISLLSFNYSVIPENIIAILLPSPVCFKEMSYGIEEVMYFEGDVLAWRQRAKDVGVDYARVRSAMAEAAASSPA